MLIFQTMPGLATGEQLSARDEQILGSLEALLDHQLSFRARFIKQILPFRPGFRECWDNTAFKGPWSLYLKSRRAQPRTLISDLFFEDRMDFCLSMMVCNERPDGIPQYDYTMLFAILDEHLTESAKLGNKAEIARLDEHLYDLFSDLSAVHQMLAVVRFHRPRAPRRNFDEVKQHEAGRAWKYLRKHFLDELQRPLEQDSDGAPIPVKVVNGEDIEERVKSERHLGGLMTKFLNLPMPKGPVYTRTWLEDDKVQRAALSRFWEGMRERHRSILIRLGFDETDITSDLKALSGDIDQDHVWAMDSQQNKIIAEIKKREAERLW